MNVMKVSLMFTWAKIPDESSFSIVGKQAYRKAV
jgi:hypothetical protein